MPKVTFSNGLTLEAYYPPPFVFTDLARLPEYNVDLLKDTPEEAEIKQAAYEIACERTALKFAFQNVIVPSGWEFPKSLRSEGLEPSGDEQGRLVDYVRYELLATPADLEKANEILSYAQPLSGEEVGAAQRGFRPFRRFFKRRD